MKEPRTRSTIASRIQNNVRQGRLVQAIVVDTHFDLATVRLSGNGAKLHGLKIIGGPIAAGDTVNVDYTTDIPTVVAVGQKGLDQSDLSAALAGLNTEGIAADNPLKIILFSGGVEVAKYEPTIDGLVLALGNAMSGDIVWLPDVHVTGPVTVGEGVVLSGISSRQSIIEGTVTLNNGAALENLKVVATRHTAGEIQAILVEAVTEPAIIRNCELHCYHCKTGDSYAIKLSAATLLNVEYSLVIANTGGATAYAITGATGALCYVTHCRIWGKTDWYEDTNITIKPGENLESGYDEMEYWCAVTPGISYVLDGLWTTENAYLPRLGQFYSPNSIQMYSGTAGYDRALGRSGNYIYMWISKSSATVTLREISVRTGAYTDLNIVTAGAGVSLIRFAPVGNRQVLVWVNGSGISDNIYLADFNAGTSEVEYTSPGESEHDWGEDYVTYGIPNGITTSSDLEGDTLVLVYGDYYEYIYNSGEDDYHYKKGIYFAYKKWGHDVAWNTDGKISHDVLDLFGGGLLNGPGLLIVNNEYAIATPGIDVDGTSLDGTERLVAMHVLNLSTFEHAVETLEIGWETNIDSGVWPLQGCVENETGKAFIFFAATRTTDGVGNWKVYELDPAAMTVTHYADYLTTTYGYIFFFSSRTNGYMAVSNLAATEWDLIRLSDDNVLWNNWTIPNTSIFNTLCFTIDDDNRLYYYDRATADIIGVLVTNDANEISFASGLTPETTPAYLVQLVHFGNVFIMVHNVSGNSTKTFYILKD